MLSPVALRIILILVGAGASFWAGWEWRDRSADLTQSQGQTEQITAVLDQTNTARTVEQTAGKELADIGAKHEEDRTEAAAVPAAIVAELRSGQLRLRDGWASCETQRLSEAAGNALERDAATQRREEFAGAVIRVARDADNQLAACQATIELYHKHFGATISTAN